MDKVELSEEQEDIVKAVREFAEGEFELERARECDQEHEFPIDLYEKAADLGFIGIHYPEEYGGAGLGTFENVLVVEELCRADSTLGTATFIPKFGSEMIYHFGDEKKKSEYLSRVCDGEPCAGMFTEPEHGSDLSSVDTKAEKDDGEWVINGTKQFITNAEIADFGVVLCQTEEGAEHKGESMIMVDELQERDGISITDVGKKLGIRSTSTGEVAFNDVRVPEENLLGKENKGFYQAMEFFDESRIEVAAQALGIAECALDKTIDYTEEREQFGQPISKFEAVQFKIAEIATKIESAKSLLYKAARNFDRGNIDPRLTCMAKWYCGQVAMEAADEAVQLHGGYGYIADYDVERVFRDAKITEIYEGTKEVQKYTIAREILGR